MLQKLKLNSVIPLSQRVCYRSYSQKQWQLRTTEAHNDYDDEFRVLDLRKTKSFQQERKPKRKPEPTAPPRYKQMAVDQDWGAVWPGPRVFHPATVPLPIRQGWVKVNKAAPGKFANHELMKVPNFLHLTPPVISKQCEALKKFCTPWPKTLDTNDQQVKHFPVRVSTSDYVHSSPNIRDPLSRIVTIKLKLARLNLDKHAKDKFCRLVGKRYNPKNDILTLTTDRCPLKKQNYDYAIYLLTALYHESNTIEDWEASKVEADMEIYIWANNKSKQVATEILNWMSTSDEKVEPPQEYGSTVETLLNDGENEYNLDKYKEQVVKMLGIA